MEQAPSGDGEELAIGSFAGEYQIERKLGQGGMGAVYGARHPVIGKRAAVKVITREMSMNRDAVDRFVREAQAVNQIGQSNIVDVFGFGQLPDGRCYFVMEWLQGETLRERMARALPLAESLDILEQIATALEAAHEAGVLHRDLKPDNIFMVAQKNGPAKVKLLDFGLAKLQGSIASNMDRTRTGVVMGTPQYISPEQAKGERVDPPTDVYSLGVIAYEMCTGQSPFKADSAVEIMAKHISERALPLLQIAPNTPPTLDQLVLSMLEKRPAQRPTTSQVRAGFASVRTQVGSSSTMPTMRPGHSPLPTPAPALRKSRRHLVIAAAAGALVLGGVAVIVLTRGGGAATAPAASEAEKRELAKPEPAKPEPAKPEPVTAEPPKPEPVAAVPPKPQPAKPEPAKREPTKPAPGRVVPPPSAPRTAITIKLEGTRHGKIWVDGKPVAQNVTETTVQLAPGAHKLHAEADGHTPANDVVQVGDQSQTVKLRVGFDPFSAHGEPL